MLHEEPIMTFRGEFDFMSNFYPQPIMFAGREWLTSEHAYQASKTLVVAEQDEIHASLTPGKVKRLGASLTLRPDWKEVRVATMCGILETKFSVPALEEKLLSTGKLRLVEGNEWGDTFWGVDIRTGLGQNMLGKLLMQIREEKLLFS